jgi:protein-tyrosine phosphatase
MRWTPARHTVGLSCADVVVSTGYGQRQVELDGCFNFRDVGGYPTTDGRRVRWRRLFRADGLHRLTEGDQRQLAELGLQTVIDLRSGAEVADHGRITWPAPGLAYHHLPMIEVLPEREELPAWVEPSYAARRYAELLDRGKEAVTEALAVLTDPAAYPAVFHCAAGKDRTGILSAVVLGLLGVPEETIVADYALSQVGMIRFLDWLHTQYPGAREELERSSAAIVAAEPETMALFLQEFRSHHGSFEDYAAALGMDTAVIYLRTALLEP